MSTQPDLALTRTGSMALRQSLERRQSLEHRLEAGQPDGNHTADSSITDGTEKPPVVDPNIVDWDGPDDPRNPRNWSTGFKFTNVALVSLLSLTANLAATMFAPGAQALAKEMKITSSLEASFTVSIYVLGFSIGPLFVSPLSEIYGRLRIYHICTLFYAAFTLGCAFAKTDVQFLIFRFLCGCAASGPMTIGAGTIADIFEPQERGKAMALYGLGPLLGPVVGPIAGGFMTQDIGWRWTFRLILIMIGLLGIIGVFIMKETFEPALLGAKAEHLRKESGNEHLRARTDKNLTTKQTLMTGIARPTKMLLLSPVVTLLSLYCSFVFGLIFLLFTTFPMVFSQQYGFGPGVSGLSYLGMGLGMGAGLFLFSLVSDRLMRTPKGGEPARPELRLLPMMWFSPVVPAGFFWYGWSAYYRTHWIVPIMGTFLVGFGSLFVMFPTQIYCVDAFGPNSAASSLAANTIARNIAGAFLPLAAPAMYRNLGLGWGNSVLGFVCLAFAPMPVLFYRYGERLRKIGPRFD